MQLDKALLLVERPKAFYRDRLRAYVISVDGKVMGEVRAGSALHLEVSPGEHLVAAAIDWVSVDLRVDVNVASETILRVQPGGRVTQWWQAFSSNPADYLKFEVGGTSTH